MSRVPVDWVRVRRVARDSFTGRVQVTLDDFDFLRDALKRNPDRYRTETTAARDEERAKLNPLARGLR